MKFTLVLAEIRAGFPGFSGHYSECVALLAAVTRRRGHEFEFIHLIRSLRATAVAGRIGNTEPDLLGFTCMTHTFPYLQVCMCQQRNLPSDKSRSFWAESMRC